MSAATADSYARTRLLELIGIERVVPRGSPPAATAMDAPTAGVTVGGDSAPKHFAQSIGAEAPPTVIPTDVAIACDADAVQRYPGFVAHLARAIGVEVGAFSRRADAAHTICFGATPPDGAATLAPPLPVLRTSPPAKRAFWRTLRDLKRVLAGR